MLARRTFATASVGLCIAGAVLCQTKTARANGFEIPSNGTEQMGRGSAWLARASDPLATYYNPAALSRNGSGVSLTANIWFEKNCFTREADPALANAATTQSYASNKVCNDVKPFPNPQLALQYRLTDKLGIGFAVMGPSAVGKADYPTVSDGVFVGANHASYHYGDPGQTASGTRYLLTTLDATIIWPQFAIGYEVADRFRVGASLIWGMAFLKFGNYSIATNGDQEKVTKGGNGLTLLNGTGVSDIGATINAHDYFIPGIVLSAMYTPVDNIDIAAWFHWSDRVKATGTADIVGPIFGSNGPPTLQSNAASNHLTDVKVNVPQPWEIRIGARYYQPREGVALTQKGGLLKDPLRDEVFDIEIDGEYAHDSSFQNFGLSLPPVALNVGDNGQTNSATAPANADVPHNWKDSYGVRFGGDYNILPGQLAVRGGAWYQSSSMQAQYIHIDFLPLQRVGLNLGATYRLGSFDLQAGYGHVFFKTLDNGGAGGILGLTGTAATSAPNPIPNRTQYPVNGGKVEATANVVSLGVVYRWGQDEVASSQ